LGFNLPLSKSKFRGAVMGLFGDRRERRDRTLSQSRLGHVDMADDSDSLDSSRMRDVHEDEDELHQLERHPELGHAGAVLAGARPAAASDGDS